MEYIEDHDCSPTHADSGGHPRATPRRQRHTAIGEVRGKGLFVGTEFVDATGTGQRRVEAIQRYCYERGVLVWKAGQYGNVLRLLPPLVLTEELAEIAMDVIVEAVQEASEEQQRAG